MRRNDDPSAKAAVPASLRARPSGRAWRYARHRGDHRHAQPPPPADGALPGSARRPAAAPAAGQLRAYIGDTDGQRARPARAQQSNGISGSRGGFCGVAQTGSKNAGRRSWPAGRPQSPRSSNQTSSTTSSTSWPNISRSCARPVRGQQALSPSMNRGSSLTRSATHRRRFESGSPDWRGVGHGAATSAARSAWRTRSSFLRAVTPRRWNACSGQAGRRSA